MLEKMIGPKFDDEREFDNLLRQDDEHVISLIISDQKKWQQHLWEGDIDTTIQKLTNLQTQKTNTSSSKLLLSEQVFIYEI